MIKKLKHYAVIPAREGSVGFPKKNQLFFDNTASFLKKLSWINEVIVSSDDPILLEKAKSMKFTSYKRSLALSGSDISIKSVFNDLISSLQVDDNTVFWLFYLPILYKNLFDFEEAKNIIEKTEIKSLCTFVPVKTHPFNTWKFDKKNKQILQYIKNDVFRRQDLPSAWEHYHYICCFKVTELKLLNQELLNSKTHPFFLSDNQANNLIEIDTPDDFKKWQEINGML